MQIYTEHISPRLRYAVQELFRNYRGEIIFTENEREWEQYLGPKILYSSKSLPGDALKIVPSGLLFVTGVEPVSPVLGKWNDVSVLFANDDKNIPFDIFSAVFYMLARYEEYLPFKGDHMQRFEAHESFAYKNGFLHIPIVDVWRIKFEEIIKTTWPGVQFDKPDFRFVSTVDVDSAFAYRHKGFVRTLGGISRDVFTLKLSNLSSRLNYLLNSETDPYDTFSLLETLHSKAGVESIYFFLLSDFGKYDKNVSHLSEPLRSRIKHLSSKHKVGIHPGVASNSSIETLVAEKQRLESITGNKCILSRQHYLVMKMPETYCNLIKAGITDDYTMGFASEPGFRAGTSFSFPWYDLKSEQITPLNIHPFVAMDATFRYYLHNTPEQAIANIQNLISQVRNVNGTFITLWHNESLSEIGTWVGWRQVFEQLLAHFSTIKFSD